MAGIAPIPWWIMLAGAAGITLLAASFYLIGVGLREALDPRTRGDVRYRAGAGRRDRYRARPGLATMGGR